MSAKNWKHFVIALVIICLSANGAAGEIQPPSIVWERSLGGIGFDSAYEIVQINEGGYVVGGTLDKGVEIRQRNIWDVCWFVKLNDDGEVIWEVTLGDSDSRYDSRLTAMHQTLDGGFIAAGASENKLSVSLSLDYSIVPEDLWIAKVNSDGTVAWNKILFESTFNRIHSIEQLGNGDFIAVGNFEDFDEGMRLGRRYYERGDYWVLKLDPEGNIIWQKTYGGSRTDIARSVKQTSDGGFIIAGISHSDDGDVSVNRGGADYWVVKLNFEGEIEWEKSFGSSGFDIARSIIQTTGDCFVIAGNSRSNDGDVSNNNGRTDYWIIKIDSFGSLIWEKSFGGSGDDYAYSIIQTTDDYYIIAGLSTSNDGDVTVNYGGVNYWVIKVDSDGSLIWQKSIGGSSGDSAWSLCHTADGGIIVVGSSASQDGDVSYNHGRRDFWVVKLSLND